MPPMLILSDLHATVGEAEEAKSIIKGLSLDCLLYTSDAADE